jgi:hypothetical protein
VLPKIKWCEIVQLSYTNKNVFSSKTENRRVKEALSGGWHQWEREDTGKGHRRVNVVEILYTMYESGKMRPVEPVLGMEVRG